MAFHICGILLLLLSELLRHYQSRARIEERLKRYCRLDKSCQPW